MSRNIKILLVTLVVLALAGGTFAFAAANTVADPGNAGYKANAVSGYTITNVIYELNTDPTNLDKITFNIAPTAGSSAPVTVLLSVAASQNFASSECVVTHPSAYLATCTFGTVAEPAPVTVASVVALDIVVSSSTNP
jgi:hypothetical protein